MFSALISGLSEEERALDLDLFDITSENNVVESMSTKDLKNLPIQIKCLILSRSNSVMQNWLEGEVDSDLFDVTYNSIVEVQTLSYRKDSNGNSTISEWSPLTNSDIKKANKQALRCRLANYSNLSFGVEQKQELAAPIIDSQFIISGPRVSSSQNANKKSTAQQKDQEMGKVNSMIRNNKKTTTPSNASSAIGSRTRTSAATMTGGGY